MLLRDCVNGQKNARLENLSSNVEKVDIEALTNQEKGL